MEHYIKGFLLYLQNTAKGRALFRKSLTSLIPHGILDLFLSNLEVQQVLTPDKGTSILYVRYNALHTLFDMSIWYGVPGSVSKNLHYSLLIV